jgi:hypothetical protein
LVVVETQKIVSLSGWDFVVGQLPITVAVEAALELLSSSVDIKGG